MISEGFGFPTTELACYCSYKEYHDNWFRGYAISTMELRQKMEIQTMQRNDASIVNVFGRIDVDTCQQFESSLNGLLENGSRNVIVDLKDLEYISSAGLRAVLSVAKLLKGLGGVLKLCGARGPVKDVFLVSGFSQMLPWFDDVEAALK